MTCAVGLSRTHLTKIKRTSAYFWILDVVAVEAVFKDRRQSVDGERDENLGPRLPVRILLLEGFDDQRKFSVSGQLAEVELGREGDDPDARVLDVEHGKGRLA